MTMGTAFHSNSVNKLSYIFIVTLHNGLYPSNKLLFHSHIDVQSLKPTLLQIYEFFLPKIGTGNNANTENMEVDATGFLLMFL